MIITVSNTQQTSQAEQAPEKEILTKDMAKEILASDFSENFDEAAIEVIQRLYSKRNDKGNATETLTQILRRVSLAVAIARLKYKIKPFEIIKLTLEQAIDNDVVLKTAAKYYQAMGERKFFAHTPCNVNASPEISLCVLQYEAHGEILNWKTHKIWMLEENLRKKYENLPKSEKEKVKKWIHGLKHPNSNDTYGQQQQKLFYPNVIETNKHEFVMGYYASRIKTRGALATCSGTNPGDSLKEIEKAASEIMDATKDSIEMSINTSSLRPWQTLNSDGSTASGPDSFVEKIFYPAAESITQGVRENKALLELRDSDHPDITLFIAKKQASNKPSFPDIYETLKSDSPEEAEVTLMQKALDEFSKQSFKHLSQEQNYKTAIRAVRNFMEHAENNQWYPAFFNSAVWQGNIYDFTKVTSDNKYKPYSVNLEEFPEAEEQALSQGLQISKLEDDKLIQVKKDNGFCFYAPDILKRICTSMIDNGQPSIQFVDNIELSNTNSHIYELNAGGLPAQFGNDGIEYRGTCSIATLNANHEDLWDENGNYKWEELETLSILATEFMDNVTTVSHQSTPSQNSASRRERRNGCSLAGVKEFISQHGFEFGSEEANNLTTDLYNHLSNACLKESQKLAEERGTYEVWAGSSFAQKGIKVRNSSMISQESSDIMDKLCGYETKSTKEIIPNDYITYIASIQKGHGGHPECFNTFSNTCTIDSGFSWEDVWTSILLSYESGIQSIAFHPEKVQHAEEEETKGLEKFIPQSEEAANQETEEPPAHEVSEARSDERQPRIRPKRMYGFNEEVSTPKGPLHVHVYFDDKGPRQIFAHLTGGDSATATMTETMCRIATKALKWGCPAEDVANGFLSVDKKEIADFEASSIQNAIGKVLKEACQGQYQLSLFSNDPASHEAMQTTFYQRHEITFKEGEK